MAHGGYLPAAGHFLLDQACIVVGWAFGSTPYLVGSALERRDYRDVDVRVLLEDEVYARWFPTVAQKKANPLWSLLCSAISLQLSQMTGLSVDFQIQSQSAANQTYDGQRVPLGIFPRGPEPQPEESA